MDGKNFTKKIKLKKVYCLNENYKFPKCYKCNKECSPFSIDSKEVDKIQEHILQELIKSSHFRINGVAQNKHLIFICKNCLKKFLTRDNK
jgi:hypothetical protein